MQDIIENTSTVDALSLESPEATAESEIEQKLSEEIATLWSAHNHAQAAVTHSKEELQTIRLELGKRLHETKKLVSRPGRGGGWSRFLSAQGIPRATADRLVQRFQQTMEPKENCPGEANGQGEDAVGKLLRSLLPRLRKGLATPEVAVQFVCAFAQAFGLRTEQSDGGILIMDTAQDSAPTVEDAAAAPEAAVPEAAVPGTPTAALGVADAASADVPGSAEAPILVEAGNLLTNVPDAGTTVRSADLEKLCRHLPLAHLRRAQQPPGPLHTRASAPNR